MKVCIVDNKAEDRIQLLSMLSNIDGINFGAQYESVCDFELEFDKTKPDVVVLDTNGSGNGYQCIKKLKESQAAPILIVFTKINSSSQIGTLLASGADFVMDKITKLKDMPLLFQQLLELESATGRKFK